MSSLRNRLKGESIDCNLGLVLDFDLGVVVVLELDPGVRSSTSLALFAGEGNPKKKSRIYKSIQNFVYTCLL